MSVVVQTWTIGGQNMMGEKKPDAVEVEGEEAGK